MFLQLQGMDDRISLQITNFWIKQYDNKYKTRNVKHEKKNELRLEDKKIIDTENMEERDQKNLEGMKQIDRNKDTIIIKYFPREQGQSREVAKKERHQNLKDNKIIKDDL